MIILGSHHQNKFACSMTSLKQIEQETIGSCPFKRWIHFIILAMLASVAAPQKLFPHISLLYMRTVLLIPP
jgi:hypothetical protein